MEDDVDGDYSGLDEPFLVRQWPSTDRPSCNVVILNIDDENDILQLNQVEEGPSVDQTPIVKDLPKVDPEAWKEEVERLAPQLKVFFIHPNSTTLQMYLDYTPPRPEKLETKNWSIETESWTDW